jgi:hypothetical protein
VVSDRVQFGNEQTDVEKKKPTEFPIPSLRQFLLPDTILFVKWFREDVNDLGKVVNAWIDLHKVIVVAASSPLVAGNNATISLAYVSPDGRPIADV